MYRLLALALVLAAPVAAQDAFILEDVLTRSGGMHGGNGPFTLLDLRDGSVVVAHDDASRADSASTAWDLGLRGNEVILNGGASGPGGLAGALMDAGFDEVTAVPTDGRTADGDEDCPRGAARIVCHGSGNGWYTYTDSGVLPIPGKTLVVVRPDGTGAKVRFVEYRLGASMSGPRLVTLEVAPLASAGE